MQSAERYPIPHGAICGAMLLGCTLTNMRKAQKYALNDDTTVRFAKLGSILSGIEYDYDKHDVLLRAVTEEIKTIGSKIKLQSLSQLGVRKDDFYNIVSDTRLNGNPIPLTETDLMEILEMCIKMHNLRNKNTSNAKCFLRYFLMSR
jgi:alcohol dehydrogenase